MLDSILRQIDSGLRPRSRGRHSRLPRRRGHLFSLRRRSRPWLRLREARRSRRVAPARRLYRRGSLASSRSARFRERARAVGARPLARRHRGGEPLRLPLLQRVLAKARHPARARAAGRGGQVRHLHADARVAQWRSRPANLVDRLFGDFEPRQGLDTVQKERYLEASSLASRYCSRVVQAALARESLAHLLPELRSFYRLSQSGKIKRIHHAVYRG